MTKQAKTAEMKKRAASLKEIASAHAALLKTKKGTSKYKKALHEFYLAVVPPRFRKA